MITLISLKAKEYKPREKLKTRKKGLKPRYFKSPFSILYV
jgi:hypothetical protein